MCFDEESKSYWVDWPLKKKVSIERDVYFNKDKSLQPNDTQIKGEWDILVALDTANVNDKSNTTTKHSKPVYNDLITPTSNDGPNHVENTLEIIPKYPTMIILNLPLLETTPHPLHIIDTNKTHSRACHSSMLHSMVMEKKQECPYLT